MQFVAVESYHLRGGKDVQVRSLAKKTFGSTRTGSAMRLPAVRWSSGWVDMMMMVRSYGRLVLRCDAKEIAAKAFGYVRSVKPGSYEASRVQDAM